LFFLVFSFLIHQESNGEFSYTGNASPDPPPIGKNLLVPFPTTWEDISPNTRILIKINSYFPPRSQLASSPLFNFDRPSYLAIGAAVAATTRMGSSGKWAPKGGGVSDVGGDCGYTIADEHTMMGTLSSAAPRDNI
jgi:hypothetical protein